MDSWTIRYCVMAIVPVLEKHALLRLPFTKPQEKLCDLFNATCNRLGINSNTHMSPARCHKISLAILNYVILSKKVIQNCLYRMNHHNKLYNFVSADDGLAPWSARPPAVRVMINIGPALEGLIWAVWIAISTQTHADDWIWQRLLMLTSLV